MGDDGKPGDYQAVALLLGLLSAPGSLLGDVLEAPPDRKAKVKGGLTHRTAGSWKAFVMGMKPRENKESGIWSNDFSADLSSADRADWLRLATALEHTTSLITLGGLGELQDWAPRIRRFSFVMSPSTDHDDA